MKNETHTPTPWTQCEACDNSGDILVQGPPEAYEIASISGGIDNATDRANAAFIVSAVNAHEALVSALEQLHDAFNAYPRIIDFQRWNNWIDTALKLAKGEE